MSALSGSGVRLSASATPRRSIVRALACVVAGGVLVGLASAGGVYVAGHAGPNAIDRWGFSVDPPHYHSHALRTVAELGNPVLAAAVSLIAAIAVWRANPPRAIAVLAGPLLAALLTAVVMKPWVGRRIGDGLSYPSGHTTSISVLVAVVVLVVGGRWRWCILALGAAAVAATAVAVVALGWHFPTDALAGIAVGTGSVLLVDGAAQLWGARRRPPWPRPMPSRSRAASSTAVELRDDTASNGTRAT